MSEPLHYQAGPELSELLRRYYSGEAGVWSAIQARVSEDLRARGLPLGPRHLRFRADEDGYQVMLEQAETND